MAKQTGTGSTHDDFIGKLSFSWPKMAGQFTLNAGQPGYDPQFPLGYGLTYGDKVRLAALARHQGVREATIQANVPGLRVNQRVIYMESTEPVAQMGLGNIGTLGHGVAQAACRVGGVQRDDATREHIPADLVVP